MPSHSSGIQVINQHNKCICSCISSLGENCFAAFLGNELTNASGKRFDKYLYFMLGVKRTSHSLLEVHWVDVVPAAAGDPLPATALQPLPGLGPRPRPAPHVGDAALSSPSQPHRQLQHLIQKIRANNKYFLLFHSIQ